VAQLDPIALGRGVQPNPKALVPAVPSNPRSMGLVGS